MAPFPADMAEAMFPPAWQKPLPRNAQAWIGPIIGFLAYAPLKPVVRILTIGDEPKADTGLAGKACTASLMENGVSVFIHTGKYFDAFHGLLGKPETGVVAF